MYCHNTARPSGDESVKEAAGFNKLGITYQTARTEFTPLAYIPWHGQIITLQCHQLVKASAFVNAVSLCFACN